MLVAAQQVFQRYQHQRRTGMANEADGRIDQRVVVLQFAVVGLQDAAQAFAFFLTLVSPVQFGSGVDQLQTVSPVDVAVCQPAGQWRQVVGAGCGQGIVRPVENGLELARLGLLERQHAHAQHRFLGQLFAQAVGHGAQVFTQDDRLVTHRLQRQQAQQVV